MPSRYNGLLDQERIAVAALDVMVRAQSDKPITEQHSPEVLLGQLISDADLSHKDALDRARVLAAYHRRR